MGQGSQETQTGNCCPAHGARELSETLAAQSPGRLYGPAVSCSPCAFATFSSCCHPAPSTLSFFCYITWPGPDRTLPTFISGVQSVCSSDCPLSSFTRPPWVSFFPCFNAVCPGGPCYRAPKRAKCAVAAALTHGCVISRRRTTGVRQPRLLLSHDSEG